MEGQLETIWWPKFDAATDTGANPLNELEEVAFNKLNDELWALYDQLDADGAMMQMINEEKAAVEKAKAEEVRLAKEAQAAFEKEEKRKEAEAKRLAQEAEAARKKAEREAEMEARRLAKEAADAEAARIAAKMAAIDSLSAEEQAAIRAENRA